MIRKLLRLAALASFCAFAVPVTFTQAVVATYHNDNQRTGQNLNESILNTANVNVSTFGMLFSAQITNSSIIGRGGSYTQPLCIPNLNIGGALHNVVFIATGQNTIMAFDADKSGGPLWTQQYGAPIAARSVQNYLGDAIGILSTPVIDRIGKTMYFVTATELNGSDSHFLHAIDITNGAEKFGGPVQIRASVSGNGDGGSTVTFNANEQNPRPALMLSNGQIYLSWGSYDDDTSLGNYHGWVMAYDAQTLAQTAVFNSTPNGSQASTWALGALAADSSGNVFVGTANGSTDTSQSNFGDSYLKLDRTNLSVLDYFTPFDWSNLNDDDYDLNGGGAVLLPDQPGSHPHLLVWGSKAGKIYLDDRDSMGMLSSNDGQVVQSIPAWSTDPSSPNTCQGDDNQCVRTLPAYWNGNVYFIAQNHGIQSYTLSNGLLSTQPTSQDTTTPYFLRGAAPSISSAPDLSNGIVWAVKTDEDTTGQGKPAALYAYDATNVANILYNSNQNSGRDGMFPGQLFSTATVANGKVYVAGREQLYVFGLLAGLSGQPPVANVTLSSPSGQTVTASTSGSTDSNGNIVSSWIDFGDGTIVNGTTATHTYANPGSYTVVATVYDNSGRVSRTTTTAAVNDPPSAVTTYHNDNARTGQQLNETILTPSNVNSSSFGKKYSFPVDGQVYAQPLYVPALTVNGATHNVVFVATEHDSVYAFDADGKQSSALWRASFINPSAGITPAVSGAGQEGVSPEIGVTGTPVIDLSTGTLYVLAMTNENGNNKFRLHALDITTGAEKFGGPALVQPSVSGKGAESVNGVVTINPGCLQRTGLALQGNTVVMAFGSCSHGWVVGFSNQNQTLQQTAVFNPTADGKGAGIWMGGGAPAIDNNGFLYLITGADADSTGQYNNSFLEFDPNMTLVDSFTPSNTAQLIANDEDLGSGGVLVLPDNTSSHPQEMIGAGKDGRIFVIDRVTLGGSHNPDQAIQEVQGASGASDNYFDTPAFWNGNVYYHPEQGALQQFTWSNGTLSSSPAATGSTVFGIHGATPSISANGTSNAILWELQVDQAENNGVAVLHAYDATNVAHELYNSSQAGSRDTAGPAVKFTVPTIANGTVYVPASGELDVYGLLSSRLSDNVFFVSQQYLDFLDRQADQAGINGWTSQLNHGLSRAQLIDEFMLSQEFGQKGLFVAQCYRGILARDADYNGFRYWVGWLENGGSEEGLVNSLLNSSEFQGNFGSNLDNGQFVTIMYQNVLLRQPDSRGYDFWVNQLNTGQMTRSQVGLAILQSSEFQGLTSTQHRVSVSLLYFDMLRRQPDPGGFSSWVNSLNSGTALTDVINGFLNSGEYSSRFQ